MDDMGAVYAALLDVQNKGISAALATVINVTGSVPRHAGSKLLVYADGAIVGTVGGGKMESLVIGEAHAALADGKTRLREYSLNDIAAGDPGICGGTVQVFIEPIHTPPTLLVIGGGHVGKALAELGRWMQWRVVLSDDRAEFCNPEYVPDLAEYVICKPGEIAERTRIDRRTYIAAVTRGLPVDINLIPALLATEAPYIGLIGSRRRWALTMRALQDERSISAEALARVHAPIGLELQAETPKEIAVSIMAEIVMEHRGGTGQPMRGVGASEDSATASVQGDVGEKTST